MGKIVYIDSDYKCHAENTTGDYREIETDFFNGKCAAFIESYRFVPSGENWTRDDGVVFDGQMIVAIKDFSIIESVQKLYDEVDITEKENRISILEEENILLKEENAMLMECLLEMSEIVYA